MEPWLVNSKHLQTPLTSFKYFIIYRTKEPEKAKDSVFGEPVSIVDPDPDRRPDPAFLT
jgi:hypothetical protein